MNQPVVSKINLYINQQQYSVYELDGEESLSQLFQFNIIIILPFTTDIDYTINSTALLCISNENHFTREISGIITLIKHTGFYDSQQIRLCIRLQPLLARLTIARSLQYFNNQPVTDVVQQLLLKIGYKAHQIKFLMQNKYGVQSYIIQTPNETDYAFFKRITANAGIFYWLVTEEQQETIYLCDNNQNYIANISEAILYLPPTSLPSINNDKLIYGFFYDMQTESQLVTNSFSLRHYNPDINLETLEVTRSTSLKQTNLLEQQHYSNISTDEESLNTEAFLHAKRAKVDSYHLIMRGNVNLLTPGQIINLNTWHFQNNNLFDNQYLVIKLKHIATQPSDQFGAGTALTYHNEAILIPSNTEYCDQLAEPPKSPACWIGHIESDDNYPQLDKWGSYYVQQHYNLNKKSRCSPISRISNFGGIGTQQNIGEHLPLNNNSEVLLSCINNNLNQPIIIGALPNFIFKSPVTLDNRTQNKIITQQNNLLLFEDQLDAQKIQLATMDMNNVLELNASNNNNSANLVSVSGQISLSSYNDITLQCDNSIIEKTGHNWTLNSKQNCYITTQSNNIIFQSDNILSCKANNAILLNAKNYLAMNSNSEINITSNGLSAQCNNGHYNVEHGNIVINCAKSISLISNSNSEIQLLNKGSGFKISADGIITVYGNLIQLTGSQIFFNGTISK